MERSIQVVFSNNNHAQLVKTAIDTKASDILVALDIQAPQMVITLASGASKLNDSETLGLIQPLSDAIAQAASEIGAVIIDGGTAAGAMATIGRAIANQGHRVPLLGIAPSGKVTYPGRADKSSNKGTTSLDPNHSHFVLVEGYTWGSETDTMYQLAEELGKEIPVVTVLINGGLIAKEEVLRSVREGWPLIVVEGSARLADEIASLWRRKESTRTHQGRASRAFSIPDPAIAEVIDAGDIYLFPLDSPADQIRNLLKQLFVHQQEKALKNLPTLE